MKKRIPRGGKAIRLHVAVYEELDRMAREQSKSIAELASIAIMAQLSEWERNGEIRIPLKKKHDQE
jgi:hypothetical protein